MASSRDPRPPSGSKWLTSSRTCLGLKKPLPAARIGYQHALTMARTAQTLGAAQVRKAEPTLLKAAETMDPGQFLGVAKNFEHQVDGQAALAEANRAHERRYLRIGQPVDGLVRIDGLLDAEGGAIARTTLEPYAKPTKGDERTPGQRLADGLVTQCRRGAGQGHPDGAGPRPQLIINATLDTLAGIDGAPAGQLEWGGTVPAETVRRLACDGALSRITGLGELEWEITHAARSIPPATRRALVARDHHCVFPGCDRPPPWCDGHHLIHWADDGPTKLDNLGLVCGPHHRKVHEEGWKLRRENDGRWIATPPKLTVIARARTG